MNENEVKIINGHKVCDEKARQDIANLNIPTKTSELTNDSSFATETYVTNKIAEASLSGGEVDLSGYVTKELGNASQITFSDGQTFQAKLDGGTLKGEKGDTGEQGPQGLKGEKGDTGEQGLQGPQGIQGDTGPQGPQGIQGEQGPAGADGLTTAISVNGTTYTHSNGTITLPNYPSVVSTANGITIADTANNFTATNVEGALAELFQSASNGKTLIANAITGKGVSTSNTDTFETMANNINKIENSSGSNITSEPYRENRVLIFEDDFNGNINEAPNSNYWQHEIGYVRNGELQYYQDGNLNTYCDGESNLVIEARRETKYNKEWTSGCIISNNLFEFQYGRVEAKMKLPNIVGAFPAFWLMGASYELNYLGENLGFERVGETWPNAVEIDIIEQMPGNAANVKSTIHYTSGDDSTEHKSSTYATSGTINTSEWHVYGIEWTPSKIISYVDDIAIGETTLPSTISSLNRPVFLMFDLAVGASGGRPLDDNNNMKMYVDWVRVYAPKTEVRLNKIELTLAIDSSEILRPTFNELGNNKTLKWISDNPNVATVYGGNVKGVSNGVANITATTIDGNTATCNITVGTGVSGGSTTDPDPTPLDSWTYNSSSGETFSSQSYINKISTGTTSETLEDGYLHLISDNGASDNFDKFNFTTSTVNTGTLSARIKYVSVPQSSSGGSGFRLQLSNGTNGVQMMIKMNNLSKEYAFVTYESTAYKEIKTFNLNTWYDMKIELLKDKYKIYIDDAEIYSSSTLSTNYCTNCAVINQTSPGSNTKNELYVEWIKFEKTS